VQNLHHFAAEGAAFGMVALLDDAQAISNRPTTIAIVTDGTPNQQSGFLMLLRLVLVR
jgi:hypothetical protein